MSLTIDTTGQVKIEELDRAMHRFEKWHDNKNANISKRINISFHHLWRLGWRRHCLFRLIGCAASRRFIKAA